MKHIIIKHCIRFSDHVNTKKMSLIVDHTREIQEQGIVLSSSVKLNSLAKRYSHSATHIDKPTNFNNSSNKLSLVGLVKEDSILLINLRNLTGSKSSCDICPTSGNYLIHRYMHHFSHNMWATLRASSCDMRLRSNDYSMYMHWDMYSPSHTMHWLLQLW